MRQVYHFIATCFSFSYSQVQQHAHVHLLLNKVGEQRTSTKPVMGLRTRATSLGAARNEILAPQRAKMAHVLSLVSLRRQADVAVSLLADMGDGRRPLWTLYEVILRRWSVFATLPCNISTSTIFSILDQSFHRFCP